MQISGFLSIFAPVKTKTKVIMDNKNKGGRPKAGRENAKTFRLSDEAVALLEKERNKSAFVDSLIRGKVSRLECPNCGEVITVRKED